MCSTCGCSSNSSGGVTITKIGDESNHQHLHISITEKNHTHDHSSIENYHHEHHHQEHSHGQEHHHHHEQPTGVKTVIELERDIMQKNDLLAERNRGYFEAKNILTLNLVSSPGSGKTTLLERTLLDMKDVLNCFVIEGDQQTTNDAERIAKTKVPVVQINTGKGCHLDSEMISKALKQLNPSTDAVLFIENVGNLVCPSLFDLGEGARVVVISVTEGDDKPIKYPDMFHSANLCIINKTDLLPYVEFDLEKAKEYALRVNHHMEFIELSATTGQGMDQWYAWLQNHQNTSS